MELCIAAAEGDCFRLRELLCPVTLDVWTHWQAGRWGVDIDIALNSAELADVNVEASIAADDMQRLVKLASSRDSRWQPIMGCNLVGANRSPLEMAAMFGHGGAVKLLLDARAQPRSQALAAAAEMAQRHCVQVLLLHGATMHPCELVRTGTGAAIAYGADVRAADEASAGVLALLLSSGVSVNAVERNVRVEMSGATTLMAACRRGWIQCARLLLAFRADLELVDSNGCTAICRVGLNCSDDGLSRACARLLFDARADPHRVNAAVDARPLLWACSSALLPLATFLIEHGASVHDPPLLNAACASGSLECLALLLDANSSTTSLENWRQPELADFLLLQPPLLAAVRSVPFFPQTSERMARLLIEAGASVNCSWVHPDAAKRARGHVAPATALGFACDLESVPLVRMLIDSRADVEAEHLGTPLLSLVSRDGECRALIEARSEAAQMEECVAKRKVRRFRRPTSASSSTFALPSSVEAKPPLSADACDPPEVVRSIAGELRVYQNGEHRRTEFEKSHPDHGLVAFLESGEPVRYEFGPPHRNSARPD